MRNIILSLFVVLFSTQLVSRQNPGGRLDLMAQQDTVVQQKTMVQQVSNGQQNPEERLVRLIDAKSAETRYIEGKDYRVIKGPAQFLHNNALILCDSAIWDVTLNVVNAIGNVKILHNQMTISSDQITYFADRSVAEVRGRLVELIDKESNKVRTHFLDYFTKDSLAMFYNGLSMLGGDSTYIESLNGFYYGKEDRFLFQSNVQLYDDSLLMKADSLEYLNRNGRVVFPGKTHAWQGGNYLTSRGGWYDRQNEIYHFNRDVYIKTKDKEIWADTLDYNSKADEATLKKDVMVLDTANSAYIYGDYVTYNGNPFRITLTKNPGGAAFTFENEVADTLFFAADTIIYFTLPLNQVDSATIKTSRERYDLSKRDPVAEQYRPSASKATPPGDLQGKMMEKILEKERMNIPGKSNKPGILPSGTLPELKDSTLKRLKDSTLKASEVSIHKDTSLIKTDSLAAGSADSTKITFLLANKKVRFFRSDLSGISDSLSFNSIDSLVRLFKDPVVWNRENQLTSDSLQLTISGGKIRKAEFTSSAYVVMPFDSTHYNQIKSTDIIAFFNEGKLSRFDALGGVTVLFYLEEDSVLTALHEKEGKVYSATFVDQKLEKGRLLENTRYNLYPIFEVTPEQEKLKGFRWLPELKPKSRFDVSDRQFKTTQADKISSIELPLFPNREIYFKELIKAEKNNSLPDKPIDEKPKRDVNLPVIVPGIPVVVPDSTVKQTEITRY